MNIALMIFFMLWYERQEFNLLRKMKYLFNANKTFVSICRHLAVLFLRHWIMTIWVQYQKFKPFYHETIHHHKLIYFLFPESNVCTSKFILENGHHMFKFLQSSNRYPCNIMSLFWYIFKNKHWGQEEPLHCVLWLFILRFDEMDYILCYIANTLQTVFISILNNDFCNNTFLFLYFIRC